MERNDKHFQIRVLIAVAAFASAFLIGWNTLRFPDVTLDGYLGTLNSGAYTAVSSAANGKCNLNTATEADLDELEGIGPVLATRIVEYREAYGPFKTVDELRNVDGIGEKTLNNLRGRITVE